MKIINSLTVLMMSFCLLNSPLALAWGKRGHQIVAEEAAILASGEPTGHWLKVRSFDLGYYANVPDFIWKRPATFATERNQHFMNLESFNEEFKKHPEIQKPLELSREEFNAKFPQLKDDVGRLFWRVREMNDKLTVVTEKLRALGDNKDKAAERRLLQESWLVIAGTMSHYFGDLCMPMHVSSNYDGQKTNQKGLHSYYEDDVVDELYPAYRLDVHREAMKQWPEFKKKNSSKTILELMIQETEASQKDLDALLALDKKAARDPLAKNAPRFQKLITKNLVLGSLTLAEVYRRQLGFFFDNNKFYFMDGEPAYIQPGSASK